MRLLALTTAIVILFGGCATVSHVDQVVLVNPTDYDLVVEVRESERDSWLRLGTARRNSETVKEEVIDMGETWVFRFRYIDEELGEDSVSRSDLVGNDWRYEIPAKFGDQLKQKGYPPSVG